MVKNLTKLINLESEDPWLVSKRTRGIDVPGAAGKPPTQTWILILTDKQGNRQFVPEARVWEFYRLAEPVA